MGLTVTNNVASYGGNSVSEKKNGSAFAALRADGSVVTWGYSSFGGDSSAVASQLNGSNDVVQIFSTYTAFAALRADGSVVTWGNGGAGGDSSAVASALNGSNDVIQIFSTDYALAALRADGSVVTWGYSSSASNSGGDSSAVAAALNGSNDVVQIFSTDYAFAALRADGSVATWGNSSYGGDSSKVALELDGSNDVIKIFSTSAAFAALHADGSVVTWGNSDYGGDSRAVVSALDGSNDVVEIFSNERAFAALRADGSVVTWGYRYHGGDSRAVASALDGSNDVVEIFSTTWAFAALRTDGSVVTWGHGEYGGDSSAVASALDGSSDVVEIFSTTQAFAALRADGSVVTWGHNNYGGSIRRVALELDGSNDVIQIFSNSYAFAALRADGSVVTWGDSSYGGDSSAAASALNGSIDVVEIFSTRDAFAALRADGSVVTWGNNSNGANSSAVASQLDGTIDVVSMANPLTNDRYTVGGSTPTDTTAPTVTTFTPADEASNVAVDSNIVFNFNEAIARGTGNIVLKTAAGETVATYDAATSNNLSISGSTLTINPTADLAAGTGYKVEFAPGSVKDLAGNAFADTTNYNFTTAANAPTPEPTPAPTPAPTLTKDAQFVVLQPGSPAIVGAGTGDDTYLLSGSMLTAGKSITISDAIGANSIQLAPGLDIASSQISSSALKLNLTNGASVTVLGADKFSYDVGGNTAAGIDNTDVSFRTFVESTLKTTVPSTGVSSGAGLVINGTAPAPSLASTVTGNDFVALQYASPAIVGAGAGNDTYLISSALLPSGTNITISDALGSNSIQLVGGLSITASQVTGTALKLTLATGATVTVLGANNFTYEAGGNVVAGIDQPDVSYASLVQNMLGTTVPASGIAQGGAVVMPAADAPLASKLTGVVDPMLVDMGVV